MKENTMGKPTTKGRFTLPVALLTAGSLILLPLAGCQPGGAPLGAGWFGGAAKQSQTTPNAQTQAYTGKIDLQFDPGLLGQQYQGLRKVPFSGGDFQIQKQGGGPPVRNTGVKPRLDCVTHHSDGSYSAYFGYEHTGAEPVTIPIGPTNQLVGPNNDPQWTDPRDRGQPTTFAPGNTPAYPDSAFAVDFSNGTLTWLLDGQQVKANKHSMPQCSGTPGPSPTPSPTPSPDPSVSPTPEPTPTPQEVVFDPADPSSLRDLYPSVPGNQEQETPQLDTAIFTLNQEEPVQVETGTAYIQVIEPIQENLDAILQQFNATVIESDDMPADARWIQVDMTTVDLNTVTEDVQFLNSLLASHPDYQIHTAGFANLESAKTFALLAQLYQTHKVRYVGLDYRITPTAGPFQTREDTSSVSIPLGSTLSAHDSWWLNSMSTHANNAWNYSMGFDPVAQKPVKVAVIDFGFAGLSQVLNTDFKHQTETAKGWWIETGGQERKWSQVPDGLASENRLQCLTALVPVTYVSAGYFDYPVGFASCSPEGANLSLIEQNASHYIVNNPEDHGTRVMSTIAAQVNDGIGMAGVAPQVQVIPMKAGQGKGGASIGTITRALKKIVNDPDLQDVGVVNISLGSIPPAYYDNFLAFASQGLCGTFAVLPPAGCLAVSKTVVDDYTLTIRRLTYAPRNTIVVASAGNNAMNAERNQLGASADEIMLVGALDHPGGLVRAAFSNWGNQVDVWAPGDNMASWFIPRDFTGKIIYQAGSNLVNASQIDNIATPYSLRWSGTSAAAPVVSGIVALMKAINPNLDKFQASAILRQTTTRLNLTDANLHEYPSFALGQKCQITGAYLPSSQLSGDVIDNYACPKIPTSDPRAQLEMFAVNAFEAVKAVANSSGRSQIDEFRGTFSAGTNILNTASLGPLQVRFGTESNLNSFYAFSPALLGGVAPSSFPTVSSLIAAGTEVKVEGHRNGNILYAHRIERATGTLSNKTWTLDVFNVNDVIKVYLNGASTPNYTVAYNPSDPGRKTSLDINSQLLNGTNEIRFVVENLDDVSTPGFAMGIELKADGVTVFRDIRGNTTDKLHTARFGANRQSEGLGPRYNNSIFVNKDGSVPGGSPYKVEVSNTSDISNVKVNIVNTPLSLDASSQYSAEAVIDHLLNPGSINDFDFEVYSAFSSLPFPQNPSHPNYRSYTWGFGVYSTINGAPRLVYFNKDGQRENLDQTLSLYGYGAIGSGAHYNTPHNFLGELVMQERWSPYVNN